MPWCSGGRSGEGNTVLLGGNFDLQAAQTLDTAAMHEGLAFWTEARNPTPACPAMMQARPRPACAQLCAECGAMGGSTLPACAAKTGWWTSGHTMCGRPSSLHGEAGPRAEGEPGCSLGAVRRAWAVWQAAHMRVHCGGLLPCPRPTLPVTISCVPGSTARSKGEWTEVEIPLSRFLLTWKGKVRQWLGGSTSAHQTEALLTACGWGCAF